MINEYIIYFYSCNIHVIIPYKQYHIKAQIKLANYKIFFAFQVSDIFYIIWQLFLCFDFLLERFQKNWQQQIAKRPTKEISSSACFYRIFIFHTFRFFVKIRVWLNLFRFDFVLCCDAVLNWDKLVVFFVLVFL